MSKSSIVKTHDQQLASKTREESSIAVSMVDKLKRAILKTHPDLAEQQVDEIIAKVVDYVAEGLGDDYSVALVKGINEEETILRILRLSIEGHPLDKKLLTGIKPKLLK